MPASQRDEELARELFTSVQVSLPSTRPPHCLAEGPGAAAGGAAGLPGVGDPPGGHLRPAAQRQVGGAVDRNLSSPL